MSCDLHGIGVLVTRPSGQAVPLCDLITAQGGRAVRFPTISIAPAEDSAAARASLQKIDGCQMIIFVSPNAVRYGLGLIEGGRLPPGILVAAVGKGTARDLAERGVEVSVFPPDRFDSETLLTLPELTDVAGSRILILRGNGGRSLLAETLRQRGAEVEYVEVYARRRGSADAGPLIASWREEVQIVTVTSCEILENLFHMLGESGSAMLRQTPVVVVSERIQIRAQELGCKNTILAHTTSDQGVLKSICSWARESKNKPTPASGL